MHFFLMYEVVPDYVERRASFREEHLKLAWAAHDRGEMVLGGALDPASEGVLILFEGDSPAAAEAFARADPYVLNGLVRSWKVVPWRTVAGSGATAPLRPPLK